MQPLIWDLNVVDSAGEVVESWRLDFHTITLDEMIEAEKYTGVPWSRLMDEWDSRTALALKTLLWVARLKAGDQVLFSDVNVPVLSLRVVAVKPVHTSPVDEHQADEHQAGADAPAEPDSDPAPAGRGKAPGGTPVRATRKKSSSRSKSTA